MSARKCDLRTVVNILLLCWIAFSMSYLVTDLWLSAMTPPSDLQQKKDIWDYWEVYYPNNERIPNETVLFIVQNPTNDLYRAEFCWMLYDSYGPIGIANGTFLIPVKNDIQIFLVSVHWNVTQSQLARLWFSISVACVRFTKANETSDFNDGVRI